MLNALIISSLRDDSVSTKCNELECHSNMLPVMTKAMFSHMNGPVYYAVLISVRTLVEPNSLVGARHSVKYIRMLNQWQSRISCRGCRPCGGRGLPRSLCFKNFICRNKRIRTLKGGIRQCKHPIIK